MSMKHICGACGGGFVNTKKHYVTFGNYCESCTKGINERVEESIKWYAHLRKNGYKRERATVGRATIPYLRIPRKRR